MLQNYEIYLGTVSMVILSKSVLDIVYDISMCDFTMHIWRCSLFYGHDICTYADVTVDGHRFSAFWLRSKCSICSYQLNIWYVPHGGTTILNWFLNMDRVLGACSASVTGLPGIAVPPGLAHFYHKCKYQNSPYTLHKLFLDASLMWKSQSENFMSRLNIFNFFPEKYIFFQKKCDFDTFFFIFD